MVTAEGKQRVQMFNPHIVLSCNVFDLTVEPGQMVGAGTFCGSPLCHLGMCCAGTCFSTALPGYEYQVSPEVLSLVRDQINKQHKNQDGV